MKNILFITTDQQRRDSLPCYGLDFMQTPALDRLAREGMVFNRCTSVSPVCQPARASLILGQYPHVHRVTSNFRWITPGSPTVARCFNRAGWHTAAIGKMHFHPWNEREGFRYRVIAEDKRHYFRKDDWTHYLESKGLTRDHPAEAPGYEANFGAIVSPLPEEHHVDPYIGDRAVEWIESGPSEPFFSWVSFNSPHDPYDPPESLAGLYDDAPIPEPIGSREELDQKPAYQRQGMFSYSSNHPLFLTDYRTMTSEAIRTMRSHYFATVTLIDKQIGKIVEALERNNLLDNTVIVFSSDHGDLLGDHGLPFKSTYYHNALMVPLIIRGPDIPRGTTSDGFVDWLDLHATFFSLAGIELPEHAQGVDISPLFVDPSAIVKPEAYSELAGSAMVMTDDFKLVRCDDGAGELYDLEERPLEVSNHYDDPDFTEVQESLHKKLSDHLLAHSRVRSFGGGSVEGEVEEREEAFEIIRERVEKREFPGLMNKK
jgi:arylsulfatase A-like enzyme